MEFDKKTVKLTETFSIVVGEKLDQEKLEAAMAESGADIRVNDPRNPMMGDHSMQINRVNVDLDWDGIVTGFRFG